MCYDLGHCYVGKSIEKDFERLSQQWNEGTMLHSNPHIIMEHPACRALSRKGRKIIPLIIETLKAGDHWIGWSLLLSEITGISPDATGANTYEDGFVKSNVTQMAEWWIDWYDKNFFIS